MGLDKNDLSFNLFTVHPAVNLEWCFVYYKVKNLALVLVDVDVDDDQSNPAAATVISEKPHYGLLNGAQYFSSNTMS